MLSPKSFNYHVTDSIATITLNRPDKLNALTFEVYAELRDTFRALEFEQAVRVVVLTGAGKGFCSGGDREEIIAELFKRDAAGPDGTTARWPVRSCGGMHSASSHSRGTTHRCRYSTPGWNRTPLRPSPSTVFSCLTIA